MHRYSHLLTGAAPDLECAACLQVDDIQEQIDLDVLVEQALAVFTEIGETAKTVTYQLSSEKRHCRASVAGFRTKMIGAGHALGRTVRSFSITAAGFEGNRLSDAWAPRAAFSVAQHGSIIEGFVQTPNTFNTDDGYLIEIAQRAFQQSFASAYIFQFPWAFSPLAYCSGVSYSPNVRALGAYADQDAERVTNWANHCYRGHRASQGYLRDIYPLNLLSEEHLSARVERTSLETWVRSDAKRGRLTPCHGKWLWAVDEPYLPLVQHSLDSARLLLAGFRPT